MTRPKVISRPWYKIGEGAFNKVYQSPDGRYVLKIPHNSSDQTDTPERSVRIWNQINPDLPARVVKDKGWVCPYIEGEPSSDHQISNALISIYSKTGRIVVDAACKNFLTTITGRVICIDVGLAIEVRPVLARRNSDVSFHTHRNYNLKDLLLTAIDMPRTFKTLKALFTLSTYRPDITDASFLSKSPNLIYALAEQFDTLMGNKRTHDNDLSEAIGEIPPLDLNHIKRNCIRELKAYINSRGSINANNQFSPSFKTSLFRDLDTTYKKVDIALGLIKTLQAADSIQKLEDALNKSMSQKAFSSRFSSGLEKSIANCFLQLIIREPHDLAELKYTL